MKRSLLLGSSIFGLSILAVSFAACSSSSSNKGTGGNDSGASDSAIIHHDSGNTNEDSSAGDDSGDDGGGGTCPDNTAFSPDLPDGAPLYAPTQVEPGACTAAEISAFEAACGDQGSGTACDAWQTANTGGEDGGGGTTCGKCIFTPINVAWQGAAYVTCNSTACSFGPNYEGCVQLEDTANGPACAAAWDPLQQCVGQQCDDCSGSSTYSTCFQTVASPGGICTSYYSPFSTACTTDLGADGGAPTITKCTPGGGTSQNPDWNFIIGLMCGGGTTPTDAGGGG